MMDLWQLSEIVSWVIVEVFVVRPSASLFESHQSPSPPSFHLAASSPFHSSLSSRPTSLPLSTTSTTSDSVHRPRRPLSTPSFVRRDVRPEFNPSRLPQPSFSLVCTQVFLCVHSDCCCLGHPGAVSACMATLPDKRMARSENLLPHFEVLHADRVHYRR